MPEYEYLVVLIIILMSAFTALALLYLYLIIKMIKEERRLKRESWIDEHKEYDERIIR